VIVDFPIQPGRNGNAALARAAASIYRIVPATTLTQNTVLLADVIAGLQLRNNLRDRFIAKWIVTGPRTTEHFSGGHAPINLIHANKFPALRLVVPAEPGGLVAA
jgi:hypothetical protein